MRASAALASVLGCVAAASFAATAGGAGGQERPSITLQKPIPSLVRVGQVVIVTGRVDAAPTGTKAAIEFLQTPPWIALAHARVRSDGAFTIRWRVRDGRAIGPLSLRVAALAGGRTLAATQPIQSAVGSEATRCAPPVPPAVNVPVGDGWIVGGLYLVGGPFPGLDQCESQPYTITATTPSGTVAGTQGVRGGHSYTLVVPAGSYTLRSNGCSASATVAAGKQTHADTFCLFP